MVVSMLQYSNVITRLTVMLSLPILRLNTKMRRILGEEFSSRVKYFEDSDDDSDSDPDDD